MRSHVSPEASHAGAPPIFLIGAPRSGTTWVAKIFDSSPDVLYRHEPDTVLRANEIDGVIESDAYARLAPHAATYLDALISARDPKSVGSRPHFRKSYRGAAANAAHAAMVGGLHAAELALGARRLRRAFVPDMIRHGAVPIPVIKTVSSLGRAGLFAHACPQARFILLLRNPIAQVGSWLRGVREGHLPPPEGVVDCTRTAPARRYGITQERFLSFDLLEQLAWHWALMNEKAHDELHDVPGTQIVRLRDVMIDPHGEARRLFAATGITWTLQTQSFLDASTRGTSERYFGIYRDSAQEVDKWQTRMRADDQRRIAAALADTAMFRLFPEVAGEIAAGAPPSPD